MSGSASQARVCSMAAAGSAEKACVRMPPAAWRRSSLERLVSSSKALSGAEAWRAAKASRSTLSFTQWLLEPPVSFSKPSAYSGSAEASCLAAAVSVSARSKAFSGRFCAHVSAARGSSWARLRAISPNFNSSIRRARPSPWSKGASCDWQISSIKAAPEGPAFKAPANSACKTAPRETADASASSIFFSSLKKRHAASGSVAAQPLAANADMCGE